MWLRISQTALWRGGKSATPCSTGHRDQECQAHGNYIVNQRHIYAHNKFYAPLFSTEYNFNQTLFILRFNLYPNYLKGSPALDLQSVDSVSLQREMIQHPRRFSAGSEGTKKNLTELDCYNYIIKNIFSIFVESCHKPKNIWYLGCVGLYWLWTCFHYT